MIVILFREQRSNKVEEYKEGRSLLERCDKLLHSIAEITSTELQPSPVSVLDSSFYKEESSPSPVLKRQIDFKGNEKEINASTFSFCYFLFFSFPPLEKRKPSCSILGYCTQIFIR